MVHYLVVLTNIKCKKEQKKKNTFKNMKYRRLDKNELQKLKKKFIDFFV